MKRTPHNTIFVEIMTNPTFSHTLVRSLKVVDPITLINVCPCINSYGKLGLAVYLEINPNGGINKNRTLIAEFNKNTYYTISEVCIWTIWDMDINDENVKMIHDKIEEAFPGLDLKNISEMVYGML